MKKFVTILVAVLVSANAYAAPVVVYDPGTDGTVQTAMTNLGYVYDLRSAAVPVTAADLVGCDVLVVGWNWLGDMSGLPAAVVAGGVGGNILLTGHDADYHAVNGPPAANTFLGQAVTWADSGAGTGMVALGDYDTAFSYLPASWGVAATGGLISESVNVFTAQAIASGVYAGLTPAMMSNWGQSYHTRFDAWGAGFVPFELGGIPGAPVDVVTIARGYVIPAPGALLLGGIGVSFVGWLRRRKSL